MIVRVYDFLSAEKPKFSQKPCWDRVCVESFKYTRRAYDIGSFEMTIPTHADEAGCIQPDPYADSRGKARSDIYSKRSDKAYSKRNVSLCYRH